MRVDPPRPEGIVAAEEAALATLTEDASQLAASAAVETEQHTPAEKPTPRPTTRRKPAAKKSPAKAAKPPEVEAPDDATDAAAADAAEVDADAADIDTDAAARADAEIEADAAPDAETAAALDAETPAAPDTETETEVETGTDAEEGSVAQPAPASAPAKPRFSLKRKPVRATAPESPAAEPLDIDVALSVEGLTKYFGGEPAVDGIDLAVAPGTFFGIVGPNGAGKTTTLSMITGLLRPDSGIVRVYGRDVWQNAQLAKRQIGVLPDRLRLFDRLTGAEFLYHAGALRGLDRATIAQRAADLSAAFGLEHSLHRLVSDYSVGMTKKIAIAAAMIHAPRLLVLDEPFESVDPVSSDVVIGVLKRFTEAGGTVVLSSHSMELTERVCDAIAIIADGAVLAAGPLAEVLGGQSLEDRFVELAGGESAVEDMEWLQNFSD